MPENIPSSAAGTVPGSSVRKIRRVVTGVNARGESCFLDETVSPHAVVIADVPTFVSNDLWRTSATPVDNSSEWDDGLTEPVGIAPPRQGSMFRILEFPPDSAWDGVPELRERMNHSTPSLDYAIVLSGEVWAVLDVDERLMSAGDVLIQRGTSHAWSNRSDASAVVAFVLIGGRSRRPNESLTNGSRTSALNRAPNVLQKLRPAKELHVVEQGHHHHRSHGWGRHQAAEPKPPDAAR